MERRIGQLLLAGVLLAALCLVAGLAMWMAAAEGSGSTVINAGLMILMATPVLRVALSVVEFARTREWLFAATATVVLAILVASVVYSARA